VNDEGRDHQRKDTTIHCAECGCSRDAYLQGWRTCRTDDSEVGEPPALAFYCPPCAIKEFGFRM
jgi:hypothetical protein